MLDVVARVEGELEADTDTPGTVASSPGGSAANFAAWTARLGSVCRFACRVGDDLVGRVLVDDLRREGVEVHAAYDPVWPTAVLVLLAQGRQRHMLTPDGASHRFEPEDLPLDRLRSAGWLHLTAYSFFWPGPRRAAETALALAIAERVPVSLDLSSAGFIRRQGLALPQEIGVVIANRDEALVLTGCDEVEDAARWLAERAQVAAVKLGAQGALICERGMVTQVAPAAPDGPVVDSTGAGDAWGAAFIHNLRRGLSLEAAARRANLLGARVVARLGARPGLDLTEVR